MEVALRGAVGHVLRSPELDIPVRQRAKFEGWLKVQFAHRLGSRHRLDVRLEARYQGAKGRHIADLLVDDRQRFQAWVMLKTCNTSYRFPGVPPLTRPLTDNIDGVVDDIRKLAGRSTSNSAGYVCFAIFPVAAHGERRRRQLERYLRRIEAAGCTWLAHGFMARSKHFGIAYFLGRVP